MMNLLYETMEPCVKIDKISVTDGMGGFTYQWTEGATFRASIAKQSSPVVTIAEQQGVNEQYLVVVDTGIMLDFHDVFRRVSDNAVFRVTGYSRDSEAPAASTVPIAKVTAERWSIPA